MDKVKIVIQKIQNIVQTGSLSRLQSISNNSELKLIEGEFSQLMPGEWLSLILLSTDQFRILFKVFFNLNSMKIFKNNIKNNEDFSADDITLIKDNMNEYCNLTAGYIKSVLEKLDVNIGMSLPLVLKSFDDFYLPYADGKNSFENQWTISFDDHQFYCSSFIEILALNHVEQLTHADLDNLTLDNGGFELL